ncbi:hypothetical protein ACFWIW_10885 [Amycolatopsis sp. NPDC058340]|uniref:hypothetical protein n=1 Tax=Amycolatopsis sp. NPDC058340 TaxID=3346453 RepID=UPI00365A5B8C
MADQIETAGAERPRYSAEEHLKDAREEMRRICAERDLLLWLHAELDHGVRHALHGLDSDLPDDAPLAARVDELHESYLDALRLASEHLTDYQQRDRQLRERTMQRDKALRERNGLERERNQLQARLDAVKLTWAAAAAIADVGAADDPDRWVTAKAAIQDFGRALKIDQPAEPTSPSAVDSGEDVAKQCQYQIIPGTGPDRGGLCIATATDGDFCKTHTEAMRAKPEATDG